MKTLSLLALLCLSFTCLLTPIHASSASVTLDGPEDFIGSVFGFLAPQFSMSRLSGTPDPGTNDWSGSSSTPSNLAAEPVFFDLVDQTGSHVNGVDCSNVRVLLPITNKCTSEDGSGCSIQCVAWNPTDGFTTTGVIMHGDDGAQVSCQPVQTPAILAAIKVGGAPVDESSSGDGGSGEETSTSVVEESSTAPAGEESSSGSSSEDTSSAITEESSSGSTEETSSGTSEETSSGSTDEASSAPTEESSSGEGEGGDGGQTSTAPGEGESSTASEEPTDGSSSAPDQGGFDESSTAPGDGSPSGTTQESSTSVVEESSTGGGAIDEPSSTGSTDDTSSSSSGIPGVIVVYGPASMTMDWAFSDATIPPNFDDLLQHDAAAATGFPVERISVTHVVLNTATTEMSRRRRMTSMATKLAASASSSRVKPRFMRPLANAGPTRATVTFTPLNEHDPSAKEAAEDLTAQVNGAPVRDPSRTNIRDGELAGYLLNGESRLVAGSGQVIDDGARPANPTPDSTSDSNLLAIVLGTCLGALAFFLILLVLFRSQQRKKDEQQNAQKKQPELVEGEGVEATAMLADDENPALTRPTNTNTTGAQSTSPEDVAAVQDEPSPSRGGVPSAARPSSQLPSKSPSAMDYNSLYALKAHVRAEGQPRTFADGGEMKSPMSMSTSDMKVALHNHQ